MDCKNFQRWLTTRNIHEDQHPPWVQDHMTNCPECRSLFEKDSFLEQNISSAFAQQDLPMGIKERISHSLDHDRQNFFTRFIRRQRTITLVGAGLAAAMVIFAFSFIHFYASPTPTFQDLNQISRHAVTAHLRGNRYMSFDSRQTEQALVMLTQKLGFKVKLPDLEHLGCTLVGGRLCALGECRAAYFILEHEGKTGSLFILGTDYIQFPMANGSRFNASIKGCDTCVWKNNDQIYAIVFQRA